MSRHERYEHRDRVFSNWHRYACSVSSSMVDVDGLEYCGARGCREPLLLLETARDVGQKAKPTTALQGLAQRAGVPAVTLLWTPSEYHREESPHCACQELKREHPDCDHGIASFRCQHIYPERQWGWKECSAWDIARWIDKIHAGHRMAFHSTIHATTRAQLNFGEGA